MDNNNIDDDDDADDSTCNVGGGTSVPPHVKKSFSMAGRNPGEKMGTFSAYVVVCTV